MKKRNLFWDNYKGILIFLVVFSHFLYSYSSNNIGSLVNDIVVFIYTFHMPAFIFASGYFSKSENSDSSKSLIKLLLYYLFFNTAMMFFLYFLKGTSISILNPYNSYWYILSLICWRLCIKKVSKVKGIIPISIILSLLIGYWSSFGNILSIRRTIAFFPFFLIGYKFSKEKVESFLKKRNYKHYLLGFCLLVSFSILLILYIRNNTITEKMLLMGSYKNPQDIIYRIIIFVISAIMIGISFLIVPNKKIPILTKIGRNSLLIYLFHRFITILFVCVFPVNDYSIIYLLFSLIATVITIIIFGGEKINNSVSKLFNSISERIVSGTDRVSDILRIAIFAIPILVLIYNPLKTIVNKINEEPIYPTTETIKVLDEDLKNYLDDSLTISYVGDLILLKDQVTSAYNEETDSYDFNDMFEYASTYLKAADLAVGVLEGPMAGDRISYSTSNYGDGLKLMLNYPDEFAEAIKNSGIDLVTTANNHLLDTGIKGAYRTLDVLDELEITNTGSYRNQEEKEEKDVIVVEIEGVKVAVLSYLSSVNGYKINSLYETNSHITSYIPYTSNPYYDEIYQEIKDDFVEAKETGADLIMVFAHMGTQFKHTTNDFQDKWNQIFSNLGADIILSDHAHAVQPIEYINETIVVNCPGNFANSYVGNDGDATALVNIHIDKETKEVIGSSIVPMYTQEYKTGYYRALPIYDIITNKELNEELSVYELTRVEKVQKLITKVMINKEISVDHVKEKYYFINNNYYTEDYLFLDEINDYEDNELYKLINDSKKVAFIGDSITEGTKNDYYPWYEPLMNSFNNKTIVNISKGGYTTKLIYSDYKEQILNSDSDLYFIALGTNDVRYRNKETCSMTKEEYIKNITKIIKLIKKSNKSAKIILISPWFSLSNDTVSKLNEEAKNNMLDEYSDALKEYAEENNYYFVNPNIYIREFLEDKDTSLYMVDFIHPNSTLGVKLYSEAVIKSFE
ncbi:MAG: CapA family protein [Bacilli bacterium]|nr:CapA family protein [Bacilli bacterium]